MSSPPITQLPTRHRVRNLLILFAIWTSVGLFYFSQSLVQRSLSGDPTPWWHALISWLTGVWIAALATPVILWLGLRFPVRRRGWLGIVLAHAAFSIGLTIVQLALQAIVLSSLHVYPNVMKGPVATFVLLATIGFHQSVITYATILALQAGWQSYRGFLERRDEAARLQVRAAELHTQLASAQLGALKAQLQPHFLFNTLNAIVSLVRQGSAAQAEVMLGRLADLLRCVLEDGHSHEVPLRRELEYLRLYLSIEEVRFQDRLRPEISAEDGLLDALVPHLCLQPIVENAIRHGVGRLARAGRVVVHARREGETLVLTVEDDGPGMPPAAAGRSNGIGLANTRARLARLYGEDASLDFTPVAPNGVRVTMRLPYREGEPTPHEEHRTDALPLPDR